MNEHLHPPDGPNQRAVIATNPNLFHAHLRHDMASTFISKLLHLMTCENSFTTVSLLSLATHKRGYPPSKLSKPASGQDVNPPGQEMPPIQSHDLPRPLHDKITIHRKATRFRARCATTIRRSGPATDTLQKLNPTPLATHSDQRRLAQ